MIIPETERKATLSVLHMGHYAVDKMNLRARETVTGQEFLKTSKLHTKDAPYVQSLQERYKRKHLKPTETPLHSWDKLGFDIFQLKGVHYLLTIDYFS